VGAAEARKSKGGTGRARDGTGRDQGGTGRARDATGRARATSRRSLARTRRAGESKKTVLVALAANAMIALAKLAGGLLSGSAAMLAEAAHSVADTTNQCFLLVSIALGSRAPDESRPFGYGQERFVWTFMAAVGMFLAGATFAVGFGAYELITSGGESEGFLVAYVILGIAFLAEGTSWTRAFRQARREARKSDRPLVRHTRETRDPNLKMVLLEDTAALIGIALAAVGIALNEVTGQLFWDPIASILIGVLLVSVALWMGRDVKHLLVGSAARPEEREAIEGVIESYDEVDEVKELLTLVLGPNALLVAARIDLGEDVDSRQVEQVSTEIDHRIREVVPDATEVFLDATPGRHARDGGDFERRPAGHGGAR
jgi:cation diffusion facilitator family transporter